MKYKITQIRERPHVIDKETVMFVKTWYEVPLLGYRGIVEVPKEQFSEEKLVKKIRAEVKELMKVPKEGDVEEIEG